MSPTPLIDFTQDGDDDEFDAAVDEAVADRLGTADLEARRAQLAGEASAIEAGVPFAGTVLRYADDGTRAYVTTYTDVEPGTLPDLATEYGPGEYVVVTQPGCPHRTRREIEFSVATRTARRSPRQAPSLGPDETAQVEGRIRAELERAFERERDEIRTARADEIRSLKSALADAEDRRDRLKRDLDTANADLTRAREEATAAQRKAVEAEARVAEAREKAAEDLVKREREHVTEVSGLKDQVAELTANQTVAAMELAMAKSGEGGADWLTLFAPHLGTLAPEVARLVGALVVNAQRGAAPSPVLPDVPAYAPPPAPAPTWEPPAYSGDGHGGAPDVALAPAPVAVAEADVTLSEPLADAVNAAVEVLFDAASGVTPERVAQLVTAARESGTVESGEWLVAGRHLFGEAIRALVAGVATPERVADVLAPAIIPYRGMLRTLGALPQSSWAPLLSDALSMEIPKSAQPHVAAVLARLRELA